MERYNVELLASAYSDLDEIFDYIMADDPKAAGMILEKMIQSLSYLENFPSSGAPLLERSLKKFNFEWLLSIHILLIIVLSTIRFLCIGFYMEPDTTRPCLKTQ